MNMKLSCIETLYKRDASQYFAHIADLPWAIWLDSGNTNNQTDATNPLHDKRFDIISANPIDTLSIHGRHTNNSTQQYFKRIEQRRQQLFGTPDTSHIPKHLQAYLPGAMGIVNYPTHSPNTTSNPLNKPSAPRPYTKKKNTEQSSCDKQSTETDWPSLQVGFYDWLLIIDHQEKQSWFIFNKTRICEAELSSLLIKDTQISTNQTSTDQTKTTTTFAATNLTTNLNYSDYAAGLSQIKQYLLAGDCYQINYCRRFQCTVSGSAFAAYQHVRKATKAPYSGFMNTPAGNILCFSPEQFLTITSQGDLKTQPIKGTRARGNSIEEDNALKDELGSNPKDAAENVMIVDLLRNDLGKISTAGSVKVTRLMENISFPTVHHLVSTVQSRLKDNTTPEAALNACFPGGSITGAPKKRAMEIIAELEPDPRLAFCGSLFHIGCNNTLNANITIRTGIWKDPLFTLWAGGGIVIDSDPPLEFQETQWKIAAILKALGLNEISDLEALI